MIPRLSIVLLVLAAVAIAFALEATPSIAAAATGGALAVLLTALAGLPFYLSRRPREETAGPEVDRSRPARIARAFEGDPNARAEVVRLLDRRERRARVEAAPTAREEIDRIERLGTDEFRRYVRERLGPSEGSASGGPR